MQQLAGPLMGLTRGSVAKPITCMVHEDDGVARFLNFGGGAGRLREEKVNGCLQWLAFFKGTL